MIYILKRDKLLLADIFKSFRKMSLKFHRLDPVKSLDYLDPVKKTKAKLELSTDIYMLLIIEKDIRGKICHSIHQYAKANNKYMKDHDKKKNNHILNIEM